MIESNHDAPPPPVRAPWFVRALAPRPAASFGERLREVVRRTAWIIPCEFAVILALVALGMDPGNSHAEGVGKLLERGPLISLGLGVVLLPALEELIFRGLPSMLSNLLLQRKSGQRWTLGVFAALAFALAHSLTHEQGPHTLALVSGINFDTSMVPASQFVVGLLLWDFVRRYGLWASIFSHMLHNFVFISLALLAKASQ